MDRDIVLAKVATIQRCLVRIRQVRYEAQWRTSSWCKRVLLFIYPNSEAKKRGAVVSTAPLLAEKRATRSQT